MLYNLMPDGIGEKYAGSYILKLESDKDTYWGKPTTKNLFSAKVKGTVAKTIAVRKYLQQ